MPLKADKNHEINLQKTRIKHLKKVVPYQMGKMIEEGIRHEALGTRGEKEIIQRKESGRSGGREENRR